MRKCIPLGLAAVVSFLSLPSFVSGDPFPRLLPTAGNFQLTLREDANTTLPPGASCSGEAGITLTCRAFIVSLKNIGAHTVHLSRIECQDPVINIESKEPNSSSGWWPVSHVNRPPCTPWRYVNLRLRPGETTTYATRLISPTRDSYEIPPGTYTLRAEWQLTGCTEATEGVDCLDALQVMERPMSPGLPTIGQVEIQDPVTVLSNEIAVISPKMPDLGPIRISFDVTASPWTATAKSTRKPEGCGGENQATIDCTVFHYKIRNLGDRALRRGSMTCSDASIQPSYRPSGGDWTHLESRLQACTANVYSEQPILPGAAIEGDFTLAGLPPRFDTAPLRPEGEYQVKFDLDPNVCFASPDGSFCLARPNPQPAVESRQITLKLIPATPPGPP